MANCESGCVQHACSAAPCTNKCYCVSGFVRENGVCIPKEQCISMIVKTISHWNMLKIHLICRM